MHPEMRAEIEASFGRTQPNNTTQSEIESVVVSRDKAVVKQRNFSGEGMLIMFGALTNRWEPKHLDSLFAVTLESPWLGRGANWVIRSAHSAIGYNLETPTGTVKGEIVFHPGKPAPEADGLYAIAEFQPESGQPLPIAVKLVVNKPAEPSVAAKSPDYAAALVLKNVETKSSPITSPIEGGDNSPAGIAAAQQRAIAEATKDIQAANHETSLPSIFGPVIERTIQSVETGTNCFLDLDTGKFIQPPPEILKDFGPEDAKGDWSSRYAGEKAGEMQSWPGNTGADIKAGAAHTNGPGEDQGLTLFDGLALGPESWEQATPVSVLKTIAAAEEQIPKATAGPMPFCFMRVEHEFPKTFAFKTREGSIGLLQIIGFTAPASRKTSSPADVKIRYRIVQRAGNQVQMRQSPAAPTAKNLIFGPVFERATRVGMLNLGSVKLTNCWIDFETGGLLSLPVEFENRPFAEIEKWLQEQGADAACIKSGGIPVLASIANFPAHGEKCFLPLPGTNGWQMSAAQLPLFWERAMLADKRDETTWEKIGHLDVLPRDFIFQTREGNFGCLELVSELDENGHGLNIRYKLVQNAKIKVAASTSAAVSSQTAASFGPVIERVLHDTEEKLGYEALDLLSGKFLSFPRQASANGDWLPPWLETNRVDLFAARESNRWHLACVKTKLSDFATEDWARATPADSATALQSGTSLQPIEDNGMDEATTKAGAVIYRLPPPTQLPRSFAFQTREGVQGLLQLTGFTKEPRGLTMRYKLVTHSVATNVIGQPGRR
jgi:hypothetical protein